MIEDILLYWNAEIVDSLKQSKSDCLALYSTKGELIFANETFLTMTDREPRLSLINPSLDEILRLPHDSILIFKGFLTFGSEEGTNFSVYAHVFRKEDKLLIMGGVDMLSLTGQNEILHQMNEEITNLQRELLRKTILQKKTLEQLNELNKQLRKNNDDKDKFLKILAHDLKNPMFAISGFSDMLLRNYKKYDENTIGKQLSIINSTTKKTYDLLEELLLWSLSQSGKIPFEPHMVNLKLVCEDVLSLLMENAGLKQIEIVSEIDAAIVLKADVNMLRTVLRNLISNAIKFSQPQGQIVVQAELTGTEVIMKVSDKGVGMSEDDIRKIWQVAELYTTAGTNGEKGSGLGLLLCKEFVEKHNGRLWVESKVGVGSDFIFTIPMNEAN